MPKEIYELILSEDLWKVPLMLLHLISNIFNLDISYLQNPVVQTMLFCPKYVVDFTRVENIRQVKIQEKRVPRPHHANLLC